MRKEEALAKHEFKMQRKGKAKGKGKAAVEATGEATESATNGDQSEAGPSKPVSTPLEMWIRADNPSSRIGKSPF